MPRQQAIVRTLGAVLLAIAGAALYRFFSAPPAASTTAGAPPRRAAFSAARALPVPPTPAALAAAAPVQRLALATAQDLRRRARYPRSSHPSGAGEQDPIERDRTVSHSSFPGPNGEDPVLTVFPAQINFEPRDSIVLYAYLTAGAEKVPAQSMDATVLDDHGHELAHVVYGDDGVDPDRARNDLVYSARVPRDASDQLAGGPYVVRVHALTADGQDRMASTGFLFSRPDADLTGHYTDAIVGGNLELQAEVDVRQAGRFHLAGTLYTQTGTALAWAQNAVNLTAGTQWIPLSFFGLILREHGEDGPYVLRFAALSTTTAMPNAKNRVVENAYVTAPYQAADFSDRPYDDPGLIEAAERLEHGGGAAAPSDAGP